MKQKYSLVIILLFVILLVITILFFTPVLGIFFGNDDASQDINILELPPSEACAVLYAPEAWDESENSCLLVGENIDLCDDLGGVTKGVQECASDGCVSKCYFP